MLGSHLMVPGTEKMQQHDDREFPMIPKGMLPYPLFVAVKPSLSASAS
jgi:hypothetical protein